jgi:hypothetical protein
LLGLAARFILEDDCDRLLVLMVAIVLDLSYLVNDFVELLRLDSFFVGDFDSFNFDVEEVFNLLV